jgi:hypothetical protein
MIKYIKHISPFQDHYNGLNKNHNFRVETNKGNKLQIVDLHQQVFTHIRQHIIKKPRWRGGAFHKDFSMKKTLFNYYVII